MYTTWVMVIVEMGGTQWHWGKALVETIYLPFNEGSQA